MAQLIRGPGATAEVSTLSVELLREGNRINKALLVQLEIQNAHLALVTDETLDDTDVNRSLEVE